MMDALPGSTGQGREDAVESAMCRVRAGNGVVSTERRKRAGGDRVECDMREMQAGGKRDRNASRCKKYRVTSKT